MFFLSFEMPVLMLETNWKNRADFEMRMKKVLPPTKNVQSGTMPVPVLIIVMEMVNPQLGNSS